MTPQTFALQVSNEQGELRRFLLALCCGNAPLADDLAQDTLLKAYLALESYRDQEKFRAWLFRIAYRTFLDHRRAQRPEPSLSDIPDHPDPTAQSDAAFQYQALYQALALLTEHERYALLLHYMNGYSVAEIATITGNSTEAVKKHLQRGRQHLRHLIPQE